MTAAIDLPQITISPYVRVIDLRGGGEIWVDGELLYQNGKSVIDY